MKTYFFILLFAILLVSCGGMPTSTPALLPPVATETQLPLPTATLFSTPTILPTPAIDPIVENGLVGAEAFLPAGTEPLKHLAWLTNATDSYRGGTFLPYRVDGGMNLLVLGRPRVGCCDWDGKTQVPLWDWHDKGLEPTLWQDIRPLGYDLSSFLGRDEKGHWWAVMTQVNWNVPEVVVSGMFPVSSLDNRPADALGLYPAEELGELQIEPIELYPGGERVKGVEHVLVREQNRLLLYEMKNGQARQTWSADQTLPGRFHLHSYADQSGSLDMTGDGRDEILVVWDLNVPPLIDAYQVGDSDSGVLQWLGRFDSTWQYMDVTGDGVPEFLQPGTSETPQTWQVIGWNGNTFTEGEVLHPPTPISPSPTVITSQEELPPIPSDIYFAFGGNQWRRWSARGGLPEEMTEPPDDLSGDCAPFDFGGYGDACYSPAGRYKLVHVSAQIEGSYTGILDGLTNNTVTIFESFTYTEGYNTFAWSPDEKFLLFARGDGFARLAKINPVTGESQTVLNPSLCGLDFWHCNRFEREGVTDPVVFADGSLGFAFQSPNPALYPPPGIYRFSPQGELSMLVSLPWIDESKGVMPSAPIYGYLLWSPDKSMFLFFDPLENSGIRTLLLGKADGSALWDLQEALPNVRQFLWER